ncbi:hypothetical protein phiAS5_ORF0233 [Aeromonas phage phiAS5]|uniref:Uncharacterized protein n=1 Tax=Aeromonas phage phiAS5 TaxID=879630 RepID=E1A1Y7_9CAUD|nr:hypothetical protein phiAS5_ORF0233 [Aeromonas phage phiAS5]ADM80076.1 hypothetical protein phiAS5_ORF0233 [Aeromonas phage phiAS5]BES53158.1 hypothetical protein [Aeromonas phage phiWae14]
MRAKTEITPEMYLKFVGRADEQDDLERCNCQNAGLFGHNHCGWNHKENLPMFMSSKENLFIDLQAYCGARIVKDKWVYRFRTMFPMFAVRESLEEIIQYCSVKSHLSFDNYAYQVTKAFAIGEICLERAEFTIVANDDWAAKEKFDKIVDILVKADKLDPYSKHCIELDTIARVDEKTFNFKG